MDIVSDCCVKPPNKYILFVVDSHPPFDVVSITVVLIRARILLSVVVSIRAHHLLSCRFAPAVCCLVDSRPPFPAVSIRARPVLLC